MMDASRIGVPASDDSGLPKGIVRGGEEIKPRLMEGGVVDTEDTDFKI